jgi:hypothetical protein
VRGRAFVATPLGAGLMKTLLGAVLLLAVGGLVRQARQRAWRLPAYRLSAASVQFVGLPTWADPHLARELADPRHMPLSVSVFDPDAEDRVRTAAAGHPMVKGVRAVEVRFPNRAEVRADLRIPAAYAYVPASASRPGWVLLADDQHVLDPGPYASYLKRVRVPLPVVQGLRTRPPGPGLLWEDLDGQVAEALEAARVAARLYRDTTGRVIVSHVDVSRFPARPEDRPRGEVRFHLADGRRVEWGRTERDPADGMEAPYARKLTRLEAWLNDPALRDRPTIDVRYRMDGESPR